jgi:hypothetical protein
MMRISTRSAVIAAVLLLATLGGFAIQAQLDGSNAVEARPELAAVDLDGLLPAALNYTCQDSCEEEFQLCLLNRPSSGCTRAYWICLASCPP